MADEFKEVTTTPFHKRIVNAITGVILGIIIFLGSFPLIFWNEGRSVDRIKTLDEGRKSVVAVSSEAVDPAYNSALIRISGKALTNEILEDLMFGVQENAIKLKRTVEMYQWKESSHTKTEKNLGGSETTETTYSYDKVWSEMPINSAAFKKREGHENPEMPYLSQLYAATDVQIGAFALTDPFIEQIDKFELYPLSQQNYDAMDSRLKQSFSLVDNTYFYGDHTNPQIGALRISFEIINATEMSAVGKQDQNNLTTYYTKNGDIALLEMGNVSAEAMFANAEMDNTLITWLIRLVAFVIMWLGLSLILRPISVLGDVVPFIGDILGAGIGLVSGVVSLVLSFITMAFAWMVFRPIIGILLLAIAGALCFAGYRLIKSKMPKQTV